MQAGVRLPLIVYDSLLRTGELIDDNMAAKINSLSAEWQIYGGYWQLKHQFDTTQSIGEEWLEDGLVRHIELYRPSGVLAWEGFVNSITLNVGGLSITRGPLIGGVENRIRAVYSTVDTSTDIPTIGIREKTVWASNIISQARYGIHEGVLSVGGATQTRAEHFRDTALAERAEPNTSEDDNLTNSSVPSVSIQALGYAHWLKTYTVNLTTTGDQNASTKLAAVLGADPNSIFGNSTIETNTVQVGAYDNDYRIADAVVKAIVALGNATNERTMFGFIGNRQAVYKTVPDSPIYQRRLAEAASRLENFQQSGWVEPYEAEVGELVFYADLLSGKPQAPSTVIAQGDPRYLRIDRATYTLPIALTLAGEQFSQLDQIMAQKGLGGTVA